MIQTTPPPATVEGAPVKPGKTSTEFWGKIIVQLFVLLNSRFGFAIQMDTQTAVSIVAGLEALYMIVRGVVKSSSYKTITIVEEKKEGS